MHFYFFLPLFCIFQQERAREHQPGTSDSAGESLFASAVRYLGTSPLAYCAFRARAFLCARRFIHPPHQAPGVEPTKKNRSTKPYRQPRGANGRRNCAHCGILETLAHMFAGCDRFRSHYSWRPDDSAEVILSGLVETPG